MSKAQSVQRFFSPFPVENSPAPAMRRTASSIKGPAVTGGKSFPYIPPEFGARNTERSGATAPLEAPEGERGPDRELRVHLNQLAQLIANITEAYSVAIFTADSKEGLLRPEGVHTLSRDFIHDAEIPFGTGLVGWTAENKVRISVCPFQHDATTLRYYRSNQDLKSFIAVPILNAEEELLGVISCDSKKNYAFAKVTEKILVDCAGQAATLLSLLKKAQVVTPETTKQNNDMLQSLLERLRSFDDEDALLSAAAKLPSDLVARDALVLMTTSEGGVGGGTFYASSVEQRIEHRLLDLVCKHKKIICKDRSVHALPIDDIKQRSFLSIPFHVLDQEVGSLNILSRPYYSFRAEEIEALERVARVVGRELERIRLRDRLESVPEVNSFLSWKHFAIRAKARLAEADARRIPMTLVRLSFSNLHTIEELAGIEVTSALLKKALRFVDQIARPPAISCALYGSEVLILSERAEAERILLRLRRVIERLTMADFAPDAKTPMFRPGTLLLEGMKISSAEYPGNGQTIQALASFARNAKELELTPHAGVK